MSDFSHTIAFENVRQNESDYLSDNQSMILEFSLLNRNIEKKLVLTSLGFKVFFGILLLIMEILGNYLLFCMIWYEKFGMDSKKRTITNQLLSKMIFAQIFFNIFFMPLFFGALLIPISKYFILKGFLNSCFATGLLCIVYITFF